MPMAQHFNYPSMTEFRFKDLRFLIANSPSNENMQLFIEACLKFNVTALVRVSERTYDPKPLEAAGIKVYTLEYPDGGTPDTPLRDKWISIVKENRKGCIVVHCVHGLGRSPVLVAMALHEAGMGRQESIDYIRSNRRGSFNIRQLEYLQTYSSAHRLTKKQEACSIM